MSRAIVSAESFTSAAPAAINWKVLGTCVLAATVEGYDTQVIGYVAPVTGAGTVTINPVTQAVTATGGVQLLGGSPRATLFTGFNPIMGDTREVWFIKNGFLYEVATYKPLDAWLGQIMQGWKFI